MFQLKLHGHSIFDGTNHECLKFLIFIANCCKFETIAEGISRNFKIERTK